MPLHWADVQDDLGGTLKLLGERSRDKRLVQSGQDAVRGAWEAYQRAGYDDDQYFQKRIEQFDAALAKLK